MVRPLMHMYTGPYVRLPDDLLARLAAISQHAEVQAFWHAQQSVWWVSAHHHAGPAYDYIHVYRADLVDALTVAVTEAEECTWTSPEQPKHRIRVHLQRAPGTGKCGGR